MKLTIERWIFVTGAPRSGTTFVGRVLSLPVSVDYIHEPFNPECGIPGVEQEYLYRRAQAGTRDALDAAVDGLFRYDVRLRTGIYAADSPAKRAIKRIVGSRGPFYLRLAKWNPFHRSAVIKDPLGCLLTEYLAERYGVRPVVLVRHPLAVAASVKRLGWNLDLGFIDAQPDLRADYFADEGHTRADLTTPVRASAWLWWALNRVLLRQAERNPEWIVLTHEELSLQPVEVFRSLYARLELPWSRRVERHVRRRTSASNPAEARRGRTQDFSRDSRALFDLRVAMLSEAERREVFEITKEVALGVYPPSSFRLSESSPAEGGA